MNLLNLNTLLVLITTLTALVSVIYGFIVLVSGYRDDEKKKYFFLFSVSIAGLIIFGQLLPVLIHNTDYAEPLSKLGQSIVNIAALFFGLFLMKFLRVRRFTTYYPRVAIALIVPFEIILFTSSLITDVRVDSLTGYVIYTYDTFTYVISLIYPVLVTFGAVYGLSSDLRYERKQTRHITGKLEYTQEKRLALISFLYVVGLLVSSFIVPIYIIDNLVVEFTLFNIVTLSFLIFMGKLLLTKGVIDFKKNSGQAVFRLIVQVSSTALLVILTIAIPFNIFGESTAEFAEKFFLVISSLMGWRVGTLIAVRLFKEYGVSLASLNERLQVLREELDSDKLRLLFSNIIFDELKVDSLMIVTLNPHSGIAMYEVQKSTKKTLEVQLTEDSSQYEKVKKFLIHESATSKAAYNITREQLQELDLRNYYHGIVYKYNSDLVLVVTGEKIDGEELDSNDLAVLTAAVSEYALLGQNAKQFTKIKQFNEELEVKIKTATKDLQKSNEKLKALDEAKDEFISMASHQLRTPLTSVKGYVSMVLEGDAGKITSQQKQLLEQAFTSSQRMVYLIADLLNVSRLKTGKFAIEAQPTYLPDVIEGEVQQLKESIKAHNLELTYEKPADFPTVNLDETKTRQVIMNFMDNAIYYTPQGGHIKVELIADDKTIQYKVVDNGLGVPKEEQHHLFTKFFRAGNAKKARPDGTGLGLFMAKKVIVAQGGSIIFESEEGKGSTFGFSFPRNSIEVKKT